MIEHVEFIDSQHFTGNYKRQSATGSLSGYIDFFWETEFDQLLHGIDEFSDVLFPNIGYTYLINLGTPFKMQFGGQTTVVKVDSFLPRHESLCASHVKGNKVFGVKFKVAPLLFEKKVNFYEYRTALFSLSYLINKNVLEEIKALPDFQQRVVLMSAYYEAIVARHQGSINQVDVVVSTLKEYTTNNDKTLEEMAASRSLTTRTLLRYFNVVIGLSPKKAFTIIRIRQAIEAHISNPIAFKPSNFGFYDMSHYSRQLKQFLTHNGQSYLPAFLERVRRK